MKTVENPSSTLVQLWPTTTHHYGGDRKIPALGAFFYKD